MLGKKSFYKKVSFQNFNEMPECLLEKLFTSLLPQVVLSSKLFFTIRKGVWFYTDHKNAGTISLKELLKDTKMGKCFLVEKTKDTLTFSGKNLKFSFSFKSFLLLSDLFKR